MAAFAAAGRTPIIRFAHDVDSIIPPILGKTKKPIRKGWTFSFGGDGGMAAFAAAGRTPIIRVAHDVDSIIPPIPGKTKTPIRKG